MLLGSLVFFEVFGLFKYFFVHLFLRNGRVVVFGEQDDQIDLAGEDQLLDEDALREMISEIVQSELQGALGERITRNVRRLVRREIHRALTARDLD